MNTPSEITVLPRCGLYRTGAALPGHEEQVPTGRLVYFHNHSKQGPPIMLLPAENRNNTWRFQTQGYLVRQTRYTRTLHALLPQGLYRLREHFHPGPDLVVDQNALVQLGYTAAAEPILFFPTLQADDGSIRFPERGMKIDERIYGLLEQLSVRGPHAQSERHLH